MAGGTGGHIFPVLAVAGGVAANVVIRAKLMALCDKMGVQFLAPPLALWSRW